VVRFFSMAKRQKYQRPSVKAVGTREKLWRIEYREYFLDADGHEQNRHKSASWSRADHTKAQAQAQADRLLLELRGGPPKADGSMTLAEFWRTVYLPIRSRKWTGHTPTLIAGYWRNHIEPQLGAVALKDITKAMIQIHLGELVDEGLGQVMVEAIRIRLHSILEEAVDNEYIAKNPARKVETPECKGSEETRSLTEEEVHTLWDGSTGRDYIVWRLMPLTGIRIGEVLPLERTDLRPDGLMINKAYVDGHVKLPKFNKERLAAIPASLRAELEEWLATHDHRLMFPSDEGTVMCRGSKPVQELLDRGRLLVEDLDFRMCRTTFASLFQGDEADRTSIMGHHSSQFTLTRYRKPIMERRQKSIEELDQRLTKVVSIDKLAM
jgi:integrase